MNPTATAPGTIFARPFGGVRVLAVLGVGAIATFLALFFSARAGLLFLAGVWLSVGVWVYPWMAFLLLLAAAPFLPILKATNILGSLTLFKDVVILTLFLRVLRMDGPRLPTRLLIPLFFLVGWSVVAFVRSDTPSLGLLRLRDLLLYVPMLVVAARLLSTQKRLRISMTVLSATGALVLLLGALQWLLFPDGMVLRYDPERQIWIPRIASVLAHPNNLGGYLLFVLPVAALSTFRMPTVPFAARCAAGVVTAATLCAVYLTYSRSAWIAHGIALGVLVVTALWFWRPRLFRYGLVCAALVIGGTLVLPQVRPLLRSVIDPTYASNRERIDFVAGTIAQLSATGAIGGEGLGDAVTLLGRSTDISLFEIIAAEAREVQRTKDRTFLDNGVLKLLVEQGVIGLVFVGWVGIKVLLEAARAARVASVAEGKAIGTAMIVIMSGLLPFWFFLDVPDMFPVNLLFWTFAGAVASATALDFPRKANEADEANKLTKLAR